MGGHKLLDDEVLYDGLSKKAAFEIGPEYIINIIEGMKYLRNEILFSLRRRLLPFLSATCILFTLVCVDKVREPIILIFLHPEGQGIIGY